MPTYNNAIPQPPDILSDSQDDILQNFQQLNTAWNVNHVPFNNIDQGMHTQVTLLNNVVPTPTIAAVGNIYSQQSILTLTTELAWQRENNGTRIEWTGLGVDAANGWTRLPSGILLKWGQATTVGNPHTVVFPLAIGGTTVPAFASAPMAIFVQTYNLGNITASVSGPILVTQFNVNTFTANTGAAVNSTIRYFAIGV